MKTQTTNSGTGKRVRWSYAFAAGVLLLVVMALLSCQGSPNSAPIDETAPTSESDSIAVTAAPTALQPTATFAPTAEAETEIIEESITVETPQQTESTGDTDFYQSGFVVDAAQSLNETDFTVYPGQTVSIAYEEGQWQAGPSPSWPLVGPEGHAYGASNPPLPAMDAPTASLIAGIGVSPPFLVGHGMSFVATRAGQLWFAANDFDYSDNIGNMLVRIQLGPKPDRSGSSPTYGQGPVAYSCSSGGQDQIYLFELDSYRWFPLDSQPANSIVPAFSKDGTKLAYRSDAAGAWQIVVSDLDGSNLRPVTSGTDDNYEANWSPDGSQIVFVSDRTGSNQIFVMDSDGSNQQQLTFNNNSNDDPSWSVTGQIAYESDQDGRFNIYQISPQGGDPLLLIDAGDASTTPAWSPDGQRLAFEVREGDVRHIWIADADGTNLKRITSEGSSNERPAWSPDGRQLAFHSNFEQESDSQFDIWVIDIVTGAQEYLSSDGNCYNPAWGLSEFAEATPVLDGIEACHLSTGASVTAGPDTTLWNNPDVISSQELESIAPETLLSVNSGPVWGRIDLDAGVSDWWWRVEREPDGLTGWVWQAHLRECEGS